jgi:hypothetical protein
MYIPVAGLQSCEYKLHQDKEGKIQGDNKWMMSKQVMENCVDVLAPRILGVWGIEEEPEWYEGQFAFQEDFSPTSHDKVQAWLTGVQNEQISVLHNGICGEQASPSFNVLNVSLEQEVRGATKSKVAVNTPQSKHPEIPVKDLNKTIPHGSQNVLTHSRKKFATSTPLNSVLRNTESPTGDTLQIQDLQVNDTFSQAISVPQNQNTYSDLISVRRTIQQSQELSQDEKHTILSHTTSKTKKKDIKICNSRNAFVAGF